MRRTDGGYIVVVLAVVMALLMGLAAFFLLRVKAASAPGTVSSAPAFAWSAKVRNAVQQPDGSFDLIVELENTGKYSPDRLAISDESVINLGPRSERKARLLPASAAPDTRVFTFRVGEDGPLPDKPALHFRLEGSRKSFWGSGSFSSTFTVPFTPGR